MWEWLKADSIQVVGLVALFVGAIVFCIDLTLLWGTRNAFKVKDVWRKRRKRRKPKRSRQHLRTKKAKKSSSLAN